MKTKLGRPKSDQKREKIIVYVPPWMLRDIDESVIATLSPSRSAHILAILLERYPRKPKSPKG